MVKNTIKTALVTGAAKRLGQAIAIELAKDGWNLALAHNGTDIVDTKTECEKHGAKVATIQADLNSHEQVSKLVKKANEALGEVTLLINNASIFEHHSFAETSEEIFDSHMNINFKAPFFLSQAFAEQTQNGHIINITDTRVRLNKVGRFAYMLSKKAFHNLGEMLVVELGPKIRVNAIAPGAIKEFCDNIEQSRIAARIETLPMKKLGNFADIYSAIQLLNDSELTGQSITVDGGDWLV